MTACPATDRPVALNDEDLMRRLQADDIRAFEELYDRYSAKAFGLARVMCGGAQRAEEALQDGFLAVWRSRNSYDPTRGSARAWLLMVIRHRSIDVMRRGRRDDELCESDDQLHYFQAPGSIAELAEKRDEADRVLASVRELPMLQREVIALAYFGGLTHTEIAARLRLPVGTVKGRMRLGLHKVRDEFDPSTPPRPAQPTPRSLPQKMNSPRCPAVQARSCWP